MNKIAESENELVNRIPPHSTILCDMDGTLVDTDYANFLSYKRAIEEVTRFEHNIQFNASERFSREMLKDYIPSLTDFEHENIINLKAKYFKDFLQESRLNFALAESIKSISQNNEVILVTSSRKKRALETLEHHKLLSYFRQLICLEEIIKSGLSNKYETTLALLDMSPTTIFVIENEAVDISKATRAGVSKKNIISMAF